MRDEERLDALIRRQAEELHRPPATPRAEIWARIQQERALPRDRPAPRARPAARWVTWAVGLAATLAVGVGIGRWSLRQPAGTGEAVAVTQPPVDATEGAPAAYRLVADEHLSRVETFLSVFSSEATAGRLAEADYELPARQLLRRTRLLRESPAAEDVALRALLDDVEFVLLQIASFAQVGDERELGFVEQGMRERSVLLRLRSTLPGAPGRVAVEGSL